MVKWFYREFIFFFLWVLFLFCFYKIFIRLLNNKVFSVISYYMIEIFVKEYIVFLTYLVKVFV